MKKQHIYFATLALAALLAFFAACGEGTPVTLDGSPDMKIINDEILVVEDYIRDCFGKEGIEDCPDISKPAPRSSSSNDEQQQNPSSPSGGDEPGSGTLTCIDLAQTGVAGTEINKPTVKCNGDNATATFTGAPVWADPEEGSYNVSATADCGGSQTVSCGTLVVGPPPTASTLTCTGLSATGVAGTEITKPTVKCGTNDVPNPAFTDAPASWTNPSAGSYTISANPTGDCKEAASCGTITVSPKLTCANLPTTSGTAGTAVTKPAVTCGTTNITENVNWSGQPNAPAWGNLVAGTYTNIKANATGDDCKDQTADCSGTLTVTAPSSSSRASSSSVVPSSSSRASSSSVAPSSSSRASSSSVAPSSSSRASSSSVATTTPSSNSQGGYTVSINFEGSNNNGATWSPSLLSNVEYTVTSIGSTCINVRFDTKYHASAPTKTSVKVNSGSPVECTDTNNNCSNLILSPKPGVGDKLIIVNAEDLSKMWCSNW